MHVKIAIKLFIVIAGITISLWGYFSQQAGRAGIALLNMFLLAVILFQERKAFAHTGSTRVFFSPDVFAFLSIVIGLSGATLIKTQTMFWGGEYLWLLVVFVGGLFYVLSVWIFGMYAHTRLGDAPYMRVLSILLTIIFVYILGTVLPGMPSNIGQWRHSFTNSFEKITTIPSLEGDGIVKEIYTGKAEHTGLVNKSGITSTSSAAQLLATIREQNNDVSTGTNKIKDNDVEERIEIDLELEEPVPSEEDKETEVTPVTRVFSSSNYDADTLLNFGIFLPLLVETYALGPATREHTFTYVSRQNTLYAPYAVAREYAMIGEATHPSQVVLCKHLMVLLGLAEGWEVNYAAGAVFDVFWEEAQRKGYTDQGCSNQEAQARISDLP